MGPADLFGGTFGIIISLFLMVTAVLWFLMPFAVFGIKNRLDESIKEQRTTNKLLLEMVSASKSGAGVKPGDAGSDQ